MRAISLPWPALRAGAGSGVLLAAAVLPGPQGALVLVALAPLLRFLARAPRASHAALAGLVCGASSVAGGFGWALGVAGGGTAGGLGLLLGVGLGLPALTALFAVVIAALASRSPVLALVAAPPLWVVLEYARSQEWLLTIPWNQLGYALGETPALMQAASVVGVYGLSLWAVAFAAGIAVWPFVSARARLGAGLALVLPALAGTGLLREPVQGAGPSLRIAAVQPSLADSVRTDPARFHENLRIVLGLSENVASGADVVVWPESAWQRVVTRRGDAFLGSIAHHLGVPVLTGARRLEGDGELLANAVVLAGTRREQRDVAEKVHPLPVYERAPLGRVGRALARHGHWPGRYLPGAPRGPVVVETAANAQVALGALVCIDTAYPELARALRLRGARVLLSLANEAATGAWSARQHARIARVRAVENRAPMVRVANTGPTLWIDAHGRVVAELPHGRAASAVVSVTPAGALPPLAHYGDAPVLAGSAALLLWLPWLARRPRHPTKEIAP